MIDNDPDVIEIISDQNLKDFIEIVNINTTNSDELIIMLGRGKVTAQKIIKYRDENGNFERLEDLMNIPGIGEITFQKLKEFIEI